MLQPGFLFLAAFSWVIDVRGFRFRQGCRPTSEVGWQGAAEAQAIARGRQESGRMRRRTERLPSHRRASGRQNAGRPVTRIRAAKPRAWPGNPTLSGLASLVYFRRTFSVETFADLGRPPPELPDTFHPPRRCPPAGLVPVGPSRVAVYAAKPTPSGNSPTPALAGYPAHWPPSSDW